MISIVTVPTARLAQAAQRFVRAFALGCVIGLLWLWLHQAMAPRIPERSEAWKGNPGKAAWTERSPERWRR
jgi:hypothetical protein